MIYKNSCVRRTKNAKTVQGNGRQRKTAGIGAHTAKLNAGTTKMKRVAKTITGMEIKNLLGSHLVVFMEEFSLFISKEKVNLTILTIDYNSVARDRI
jgi:hypothetical protein